jgi:hypothetical protein
MENKTFECTNCGWVGTESEKIEIPDKESVLNANFLACPKCEGVEFYINNEQDI